MEEQVIELESIERKSGKRFSFLHSISDGIAYFLIRTHKPHLEQFFQESFTARDISTIRAALDAFEALERERQVNRPRGPTRRDAERAPGVPRGKASP
jgi:hypothetical protein